MLVNIGIPPTSILKSCLPSNQPAPGYVPIEFDMAPIVRSLGLGTSARKASNTGLFCAQCSAGDEPGVNKNVELDDFPMKTSPFVVGFPSHSAEKIRKDLDGDWGGFGPRVSELDLNRAMENVPCIDDSWWFMMIYWFTLWKWGMGQSPGVLHDLGRCDLSPLPREHQFEATALWDFRPFRGLSENMINMVFSNKPIIIHHHFPITLKLQFWWP